MFKNVSDIHDVPLKWISQGYGTVLNVPNASALSPMLWFISSTTLNEPVVQLRPSPGVIQDENKSWPIATWKKRVVSLDALTQEDATTEWVPEPLGNRLFAEESTLPYRGNSYSWNTTVIRMMKHMNEHFIVVHVHRIDSSATDDNFGDAISTEAALALLQTRGAKRSADGDNIIPNLAMDAVRSTASLVVVCVDEAVIGEAIGGISTLANLNMAARSTKLNHMNQVMNYIHETTPLIHRTMSPPLSCVFEPAIPQLNEQYGLALSLFDHQRRAVHWMLRMENDPGVILVRNIYANPELMRLSAMFETVDGNRSKIVFGNIAKQTHSITVRGGMLCAPTGSGKTTCAIALIHVQQAIERNGRKFEPGLDNRYYSPATLVVAPRQVVQQWVDEFKKTLTTNVRILVIATARSAQSFPLDQLGGVDVVIMCKEVFASGAYRGYDTKDIVTDNASVKAIHGNALTYTTNDASDRRTLFTANSNDKTARAGSYFVKFNAHAVHWRRVIVDEMHELDTRWTMIERAVSTLTATVTWGLTATPNFGTAQSFSGASGNGGYAKLMNIQSAWDQETFSKYAITQASFVRRASLTTDMGQVPSLTMHRVNVRMTAGELAIYAGCVTLRDRLLFCSHHDAASNLPDDANGNMRVWTLTEATANVGKSHEIERKRAEKEVATSTEKLESAWKRFADVVEELDVTYLDVASAFIDGEVASLAMVEGLVMLLTFVIESITHKVRPLTIVNRMLAKDDEEEKELPIAKDDEEEEEEESFENLACTIAATQLLAFAEALDDEDRMSVFSLRADLKAIQAQLLLTTDQLSKANEALKIAEGRCNFFKGVLAELADINAEIECPICYEDDAMSQDVVITTCGHRFCVPCSNTTFANVDSKCPNCRMPLRRNTDIRTVHRAPQQEPEAATNIELHGSKLVRLAALIEFLLATEPDAKIIVFAQFERLLRLIARTMTAMNVGQFVTVRGSIHQCQKSIDAFHHDPLVRIMLLSSETTISGITLVEANHVIAVHPPLMDENTEKECSLLWQAVGRIRRVTQTKPCHLWSLATRDTVEVEMYERQRQFIATHHPGVTFVEQE